MEYTEKNFDFPKNEFNETQEKFRKIEVWHNGLIGDGKFDDTYIGSDNPAYINEDGEFFDTYGFYFSASDGDRWGGTKGQKFLITVKQPWINDWQTMNISHEQAEKNLTDQGYAWVNLKTLLSDMDAINNYIEENNITLEKNEDPYKAIQRLSGYVQKNIFEAQQHMDRLGFSDVSVSHLFSNIDELRLFIKENNIPKKPKENPQTALLRFLGYDSEYRPTEKWWVVFDAENIQQVKE